MAIRDWLASRTVRAHALFSAAYAAAMPILVGFSDADWQALGFSERGVVLVMAAVGFVHSAVGIYMRSITSEPLKGRSE